MEMVLPSNYIEVEQEEMMYLDGGWSWVTFRNNMLGLVAFGTAVGLLGKKVAKLMGSNTAYLKVVAAVGPTVAKIGSFFGGWIGLVVFGVSAAAAIYYLGNNRVFY